MYDVPMELVEDTQQQQYEANLEEEMIADNWRLQESRT